MSGKIMCYLDCGMFGRWKRTNVVLSLELTFTVSPYSYFALLYLERNRETLSTHNVEIE